MKKGKFLIWHADDLGTQFSQNAGILEAATKGFLTSASIRTNGVAFEDACKRVIPACPQLGLGVHICLNEGSCTAPSQQVPLLADQTGHFKYVGAKGFISLAWRGISRKFREQTEIEMRCQIEKIISILGSADHIDGHMHIHAIPWIFKITLALAEEYGISFIRVPREPLILSALQKHRPHIINFAHYLNLQTYTLLHRKWLSSAKVLSNDWFFGLLHTSAMNENVTKALLSAHKRQGITEFLFHPALPVAEPYYLEKYLERFFKDEIRQEELHACMSENIKNIIKEQGWLLTNYHELARDIKR